MKCLNCDNEAVGRSKYCSDSCRTTIQCQCSHIEVETHLTITADGHRDYEAKCKHCGEILDTVFWLVGKVNKLLKERAGL